ncbi:hypothetical protein LTR74_018032 [Friedmanniomyces endolithicus]|nr:hypothetical protein LTR74_018032 [Friedmanniomyces endolithicus]
MAEDNDDVLLQIVDWIESTRRNLSNVDVAQRSHALTEVIASLEGKMQIAAASIDGSDRRLLERLNRIKNSDDSIEPESEKVKEANRFRRAIAAATLCWTKERVVDYGLSKLSGRGKRLLKDIVKWYPRWDSAAQRINAAMLYRHLLHLREGDDNRNPKISLDEGNWPVKPQDMDRVISWAGDYKVELEGYRTDDDPNRDVPQSVRSVLDKWSALGDFPEGMYVSSGCTHATCLLQYDKHGLFMPRSKHRKRKDSRPGSAPEPAPASQRRPTLEAVGVRRSARIRQNGSPRVDDPPSVPHSAAETPATPATPANDREVSDPGKLFVSPVSPMPSPPVTSARDSGEAAAASRPVTSRKTGQRTVVSKTPRTRLPIAMPPPSSPAGLHDAQNVPNHISRSPSLASESLTGLDERVGPRGTGAGKTPGLLLPTTMLLASERHPWHRWFLQSVHSPGATSPSLEADNTTDLDRRVRPRRSVADKTSRSRPPLTASPAPSRDNTPPPDSASQAGNTVQVSGSADDEVEERMSSVQESSPRAFSGAFPSELPEIADFFWESEPFSKQNCPPCAGAYRPGCVVEDVLYCGTDIHSLLLESRPLLTKFLQGLGRKRAAAKLETVVPFPSLLATPRDNKVHVFMDPQP